MQIVSASRRTDIPAWYGTWFMNRIRAGRASYKNPFGGTVHTVSLRPEDVAVFLFWTRDPGPFLPHLDTLLSMGYKAAFQFTITGYGPPLEGRVLPPRRAVRRFKELSDRLGPRFTRWRYDPILLAPGFEEPFHLKNFSSLAAAIEGYTDTCHVSFVQFYQKTRRNLETLGGERGVVFEEPEEERKIALAASIAEIAAAHGIRLVSCCYPSLARAGIPEGACVDPELVYALRPDLPRGLFKPRPTRPGCRCVESRDIGAYDTCLGGCLYCYATANRAVAHARHRDHDPDGECLA